MFPRTLTFLAPVLTIAASLSAQTQVWTPTQILYKGAPQYKPADLNAVLALKLDGQLGTADVDPALQRLADTGLFADIRYTIDNRAIVFTLTPQPDSAMLPAIYSNFVLFQSGELTPLIHAHVPLFNGKIPAAGSLQQSVQDALAAILRDKGFANATVDSVTATDPDTHHIDGVEYSITNPPVQIRSLQVEDVSPAAQAKVAEIQKAIAGSDYEYGSENAVQKRLEDAYKDLAYLDIAIGPPTHSAPTVTADRILVDLATVAHEGSQYRLAKLELPATSIVSAADLEKAATLKPGDLATRIGLLSTASRVDRQFTRHGYMDAKFSATTTKDSAAHTVVYTLSVVPGEQFHLASVKALNLTPQQQKEFDSAFKLKPGDPYDEGYVETFLKQNKDLKSLTGYSGTYKQAAHLDTHEVDLTLTFVKGGTLTQ
jgi:outer membrane protein insertion porin family